ncbi:hypothetical protein HWV62_2528 [Athelia sp. TMB]|nr:hypothetical protein HWV62_2528 [Athelia sp. TMB]
MTSISEEDPGDLPPLPALTTYVTIKLDPVKSVEFLEDEEATAAARDMTGKVYVGYVGNAMILAKDAEIDDLQFGEDWDDEDMDYGPFLIHILRSGRPRPSAEEFIEEDMCTPVFPNVDHPSRQSLVPSKPLPGSWRNCYHATFETVTLRVPIACASMDMSTTMSDKDRLVHATAMREDRKRRAELAKAPWMYDHAPIGYTRDFAISKGPEPIWLRAPSQSSSSYAETASLIPGKMRAKPLRSEVPVCLVSYNLTAVSTLADPQDLLEEIRIVEKLCVEAEARAGADTTRPIAEA